MPRRRAPGQPRRQAVRQSLTVASQPSARASRVPRAAIDSGAARTRARRTAGSREQRRSAPATRRQRRTGRPAQSRTRSRRLGTRLRDHAHPAEAAPRARAGRRHTYRRAGEPLGSRPYPTVRTVALPRGESQTRRTRPTRCAASEGSSRRPTRGRHRHRHRHAGRVLDRPRAAPTLHCVAVSRNACIVGTFPRGPQPSPSICG
jgi:hypothetical protein